MNRTFDTPDPVALDIRLPSGRIRLETAETAQTEVSIEPLDGPEPVDERVRIGIREDRDRPVVTVEVEERWGLRRGRSYDLRVRCPHGTSVKVRTASADVEALGRYAALDGKLASGDLRIEAVEGPVRVDTASGEVRVDRADGPVEIRGASGDAIIGRADGQVRVNLASGDVTVHRAGAAVEANSMSGDISVQEMGQGSATLRSVSGEISVGVLPDVDVWLDLHTVSGRATSDLTKTDAVPAERSSMLEIRATAVSGDIRIRRAEASDAVAVAGPDTSGGPAPEPSGEPR